MNTINFDDTDKIERLNSRIAELLAEVAALKRHAQGALPASLRSELIQLEAVVHDARCSNEVIGMRIRNTWDTYRHAINSAVTSTQPYPTENIRLPETAAESLLLRRLGDAQRDCMVQGQAAAAILLQDVRVEIVRLLAINARAQETQGDLIQKCATIADQYDDCGGAFIAQEIRDLALTPAQPHPTENIPEE